MGSTCQRESSDTKFYLFKGDEGEQGNQGSPGDPGLKV